MSAESPIKFAEYPRVNPHGSAVLGRVENLNPYPDPADPRVQTRGWTRYPCGTLSVSLDNCGTRSGLRRYKRHLCIAHPALPARVFLQSSLRVLPPILGFHPRLPLPNLQLRWIARVGAGAERSHGRHLPHLPHLPEECDVDTGAAIGTGSEWWLDGEEDSGL
ncbi:hypothetical protein B0H19DRAFT_1277205 [Mycena capillaripes]|nr:hypothetical protein B0H19DRAFT_1277205 [Mycena capillaripes]